MVSRLVLNLYKNKILMTWSWAERNIGTIRRNRLEIGGKSVFKNYEQNKKSPPVSNWKTGKEKSYLRIPAMVPTVTDNYSREGNDPLTERLS